MWSRWRFCKESRFDFDNFAKDIVRNSKVNLFLITDQYQLAKFIKNNIYGKKIVVGMGAGSISAWMKELPKLIYANWKNKKIFKYNR